jgi:ATP adenylyltransferase
MKNIYAPWRNDYIKTTAHKSNKERLHNDCVFCDIFKKNEDEKSFILKRLSNVIIVLNKYPYNGGHLMVLPISHTGKLTDLSPEARCETMEAISLSMSVLEKTIKPQGFNVGLNQGAAGGGGIPTHLHFHVLPRWEGDTNYMPLLADTKPLSVDLNEIYKTLKKAFDEA